MPADFGNGRPDVSDVLGDVSAAFRRNLKRFGPLLAAVLLVALAATGVYSVQPGEVGVVRRFGREHRKTGPGLQYRVPFVDKLDVVNVERVQRIEVGFRGDDRMPDESLMLTGDENIVEVQMIVQYRIAEPTKYLFRIRDAGDSLRATAEVALRSMVGRTSIDDAITTGRDSVQAETRAWLQKLMDQYESGLEITEVKLLAVDAPDEVKDAFHAVTRAKEEKEKLINEAGGYRADKVPRARGEATKQEREAEGYKEQRVLRANGDVASFASVLAEYKKGEAITRQRLYLETVERILSRLEKKVFVDKDVAKGSTILPLGNVSAAVVAGAKGGQ